jgi:virulence-associated protein VagC
MMSMMTAKTDEWESLMQAIDMFSEDFMEEGRVEDTPQERENL